MLHRTCTLTEESTYLNRCGRRTTVDVSNDTLKAPLCPHGKVASVFLGVGAGRNGKLLFKGDKVLDGETCCQVGATVNNMYFKITAYISNATLQNDTGEDRFAKQLD